jgi:RNA polymerase sigma-70 factor, ECF subfamily
MAVSNGPAAGEVATDEAGFEHLVEPLMHRAYQIAFQVLGDREAAQDAAQEAAVTAWQKLGQLRAADPTGWFLRIALNKARAARRRRWFSVIRSASLPDAGSSDPTESVADRLDLVAVLRRLSATDRITLILLHAMDIPHAQAATVLGLTERGVRSRERRALGRIRPYLEGFHDE